MKYGKAGFLCLTLLFSIPGTGQSEVDGTWGMGIVANYEMPLFALNSWFPSGGVNVGASIVNVKNATWTFELDGQYTKYSSGDLEKRSFLFGGDGQSYNSPNANSEMVWASLAANFLYHFNRGGEKMESGGGAPYLLIGAGFYHFKNKMSGLIYPGQSGTTIDPNVLLRSAEDVRTEPGVSLGFGIEYFASQSVAIDIRGQYHIIWGETRSMEAWGLEKAYPFHKFNGGARIKFYFAN